jgi:hypothetical protein
MIIQQISVFLENKSGRLTEVTEVLARNAINITALSVAETSEYGILRIIVTNPTLAVSALKHEGFAVNTTDVLCVVMPNEPGSLARTLRLLSNASISIEYMYAFSMGKKAMAVVRCDNLTSAIDVLTKHEMELIRASDLHSV